MANIIHTSGQPTHDLFGGLSDKWSDIVMSKYGEVTIGVRLAQASLFPDGDVARSRAFHYWEENDTMMDFFQQDDNEVPEVMRQPMAQDRTISVCQEFKLRDKVSHYERWALADKWSIIEKMMADNFKKSLALKLDNYLISTILLSAAPYNQGTHAGKDSRSINLGSQDANALDIQTGQDFIDLINNMISVAEEVGMFKGTADVRIDGGQDARPMLLIPQRLSGVARKALQQFAETCNDCSLIRNYNGQIGRIWGIDILTTRFLQPVDLGPAVGKTMPVVMLDPNYVWSYFEVISNGEEEHLFETEFGIHIIYDSAVLLQDAVIIAEVKAN